MVEVGIVGISGVGGLLTEVGMRGLVKVLKMVSIFIQSSGHANVYIC